MAQSNIATTAGILSLIVGVFMFLIAIQLMRRYFERKKQSTLYLSLSIIGWLGAIWSVTLIYFTSGSNLEYAIFNQKVVYVSVFFGTILTYLFASEIFFQPTKQMKIAYISVGVIMAILIFAIDSVSVGEFPDGTGYPLLNIKLPFIILLIVYIIPTTIGIFWLAWKTSRKVEERQYQIGFKVIAIAEIFLVLTFVSDTLQGIFIDNITLYATFLYLTWVFPLLAGICYYIGYIMPGWFMKYFATKN